MTPAAVAAFLLLASDLPTKPTAEPQSAKELYNAWRWYGLPLPPAGAKLIRREVKDANGTSVRLQLRLRPLTPTHPALVRVGTYDWTEFRPSWLRTVRPTNDLLKEWDEQRVEEWLALSAHAWHLGWAEFAEEALREGRGWPSVISERASENPRHLRHILQWLAWRDVREAITTPGTDRHALLVRLERASDECPEFMRTPHHAELLRRLRATVRPSSAAPGSVEALIDGLVDEDVWGPLPFDDSRSPCRLRLVERGFEAVPALIAHVTDDRLTRGFVCPLCGNNATLLTGLVTVGDYCRQHLERLSNDRIEGMFERDPAVFQRNAREWFREASRVGEEAWAVRHVLPLKEAPVLVNDHLLRLIRLKYAGHLPRLYRELLADWPDDSSTRIAAELALSRLPAADKLACLWDGFGHERFTHRLAATEALAYLEPAESRRWLVRLLDELAGVAAPGKDDVVSGARRVLAGSNDPDGWAAFRRCYRTLLPAQRVTILDEMMADLETREPYRVREPLRLMTEALSDEGVRRLEPDDVGPEQYPTIAVQDFAALKLAEFFDIDVPWKPDRSAAEWAAVRADVRAALAKYTADHR